MTPEENARALARRARMLVRIYAGFPEHERDNRAYWMHIPVAERVMEVWRLSEEQWRLRGEFPDEPGLCRSLARVVRR